MDDSKRRMLAATALLFGGGAHSIVGASEAERLIAAFGHGTEPVDGGVTLILPPIAENGSSVPLSFNVDRPMTQASFVESVMILAPGNPLVRVATFHFTPLSGAAKAATRIRLERTQDVTAVARLSDGSMLRAVQRVKVTIGGCSA